MPAARDGESGGILLVTLGNFTFPAGAAQFRTDENEDSLTFTPVDGDSFLTLMHFGLMLSARYMGKRVALITPVAARKVFGIRLLDLLIIFI